MAGTRHVGCWYLCYLLGLVLLLASGATSRAEPCVIYTSMAFAKKGDLPLSLLESLEPTLGFALADKGAPFRRFDLVTRETVGLPTRRFISAWQIGDILRLYYEQGGRAESREVAVFQCKDGQWILGHAR